MERNGGVGSISQGGVVGDDSVVRSWPSQACEEWCLSELFITDALLSTFREQRRSHLSE